MRLFKIKNSLRPYYYALRRFTYQVPLWIVRLLRFLPIKEFQVAKERLFPPQGIHQSTAEWVKQAKSNIGLDEADYIEVDAQAKIQRNNTPKTVEKYIHKEFDIEKESNLPASFIGIIPQGRVWGESGFIITPDNQLLADISVHRNRGVQFIFSDWRLLPLHKVSGTVAVLSTCAASIYYHWVVDLLLRYALLQRAGFYPDKVNYFVIGSYQKPFQRDSLKLLGIQPEQIIESRHYRHIQADCLVIPSYPAIGGQFRRWHFDFLRQTFLPGQKPKIIEKSTRIYISRGKASYRRVLNEAEVIACLNEFGFIDVKLEQFSFMEQIALMTSVEAVVAPHGSGLTNIIFCKPNTKVIEIFSPELVGLYYWKISDILDLDYYYILGEGNKDPNYEQPWDARADIIVDIRVLKNTLKLADIV